MRALISKLAPLAWFLVFVLALGLCTRFIFGSVYDLSLGPESLRFERPWAALLLIAAPLALLARGWLHRVNAPRLTMSRARDLAAIRPGWRRLVRGLPAGARAAALLALGFALMGPQSVHARDRAEVEGIDIVLTLDMSLSMEAADIRPNRFNATQYVVDDFIRRRPNDRIGAVVFGKDAYTLLPLTTDRAALRNTIAELQLGTIDGRGTAIGNALGVSLNRLRRSEAESKVVILLTDGDSNSGNISPQQASEYAETMGVRVYTILMGESAEGRVQRGTDFFGNPVFDRGNFPVNPELLQSMAQRTGGTYFAVSDREGLIRSFHAILDQLERSEIEDQGRVYGELYPALLWPALMLLLLEMLVSVFIVRRWP